jgi:hypothetical protein
MMEMHATRAEFLLGPLLLLLLLAGIAGVIALVAFRKTRVLGIVLLCLGGLFVVVIFLGILSYRMAGEDELHSSATAIEARTSSPSFRRNGRTTVRVSADARRVHESNTEYLKHYDEIRDFYKNGQSQNSAKGNPSAPPSSVATSPDKTAKKAAAEPSPPAASPTVKVFEAIGRALSKAAGGEKKPPVVTKAVARPPSPGTDDQSKRTNESVVPKAAPKPPPAKPLPEWVNRPPQMAGNGVYQMSIVVGPWPTLQDCEAHLPEELQKALDQYAEKCLGSPPRSRIGLPTEYFRQHLVVAECEEDIETESVGRMKQLHVLLRFDSDVKDRILGEHHRAVAERRLWAVGIGVAAVLWPLAIVFAYLKIDLATGGAYRGRLRFAALLAILAPIAAALAVIS